MGTVLAAHFLPGLSSVCSYRTSYTKDVEKAVYCVTSVFPFCEDECGTPQSCLQDGSSFKTLGQAPADLSPWESLLGLKAFMPRGEDAFHVCLNLNTFLCSYF